jgi:hypothetical protein
VFNFAVRNRHHTCGRFRCAWRAHKAAGRPLSVAKLGGERDDHGSVDYRCLFWRNILQLSASAHHPFRECASN